MVGRRKYDASPDFNLCEQSFRILKIDPTATKHQVELAFARAQQEGLVSEALLVGARNTLIDPRQRLLADLRYPIDCPQHLVDSYYEHLSGSPVAEVLAFADQIGPLSRANLLAKTAARKPAEAALIEALVASHGYIDYFALYHVLKRLRGLAEFPYPGLADLGEHLQELLKEHALAAMAGYATADDAVAPLLACARNILAVREQGTFDALNSVLSVYEDSISVQISDKVSQIASSCQRVKDRPADEARLASLAAAIGEWVFLCSPLIFFDTRSGNIRSELEIPIDILHELISALIACGQYETANSVLDLGRDTLKLIPTADEFFAEATRAVEELLLRDKLQKLNSALDHFRGAPDLLAVALERDGFGPNATGLARELRETFIKAVEKVGRRHFAEPWMLIRGLAVELGRGGKRSAARILIAGLIEEGKRLSAPPSLVMTLGQDLGRSTARLTEAKGNFSDLARNSRGRIGVRALTTCCAIGLSAGLYGTRAIWIDAFVPKHVELRAEPNDEEIKPAVGTGQHFSLGNVRYCRFQDERLRIAKSAVHEPGDVRAFNLLVVDYNARCSDFFYRDSDVARVAADLAANKQRLQAQAEQIVATLQAQSAKVSAREHD
jgi:hypothetical protein